MIDFLLSLFRRKSYPILVLAVTDGRDHSDRHLAENILAVFHVDYEVREGNSFYEWEFYVPDEVEVAQAHKALKRQDFAGRAKGEFRIV
jgi:hypothetical protein